MPRIRYLRLGQMESVGSAGNTTANLRCPIGFSYLGLIFILANTTTGVPASWSGNDIVRTLHNGKIGTQTTMERIGIVQDKRQLGPLNSFISFGTVPSVEIQTRNSITFPMRAANRGTAATPPPDSVFFLNFGQENAAPALTRRFLTLNTGALGSKTFDVQIQMGSYTTPQVTVIAIVNDDPSENQQTDVVTMIRENQWAFTGAGERVITDLPPYTYRSITFDGLDGAEEGFSLTLDSLELSNTIDVGLPNNRATAAAACNAVFGIAGTQTSNQGGATIDGPQTLIFDPSGNADNLAVVTNQSNVQLRIVVDAAKTVTGLLEILGNPLTT